MIDAGVKATEKVYLSLLKKLEKIYGQAVKDLRRKLRKFVKRYSAKNMKMLDDLAKGIINEQQYQSWLMGQVFQGKAWKTASEPWQNPCKPEQTGV